jgi:hypothetical protein
METVALSPESKERLRRLDHELRSKKMEVCFILRCVKRGKSKKDGGKCESITIAFLRIEVEQQR